ncbi:MAG: hypothetical protein V1721_01405 [Pseudomonadota bacterium]
MNRKIFFLAGALLAAVLLNGGRQAFGQNSEPAALTRQLEKTTDEKIRLARRQIQNTSGDASGYAEGLKHPDPYVRAAAALGIEELSRYGRMRSFEERDPSEEIMNQLAGMAQKDEPLVGIEAAAAYFGWFHLAKKEVLAEIIVHVVDLLDHPDEYIALRAAAVCERVTSLANLHDNKLLGEKFIDALANKIKSSKDEKTLSRTRYYIGAASYFFRSKRGLDFMLNDFESQPEDYEGFYSPYKIIVFLNAKEYIPFLKQKLQGADGKMQGEAAAALMKLGVDVYDRKDLSSPNKVVINFWKAIEQGDDGEARSLLDSSRIERGIMDEIINDHKEVLKHFTFYQLDYFFDEASFSPGRPCTSREQTPFLGEEGYSDKTFGTCIGENVSSLRAGFPDGPYFLYFLGRKEDGRSLIQEIRPKLSSLSAYLHFESVNPPVRRSRE